MSHLVRASQLLDLHRPAEAVEHARLHLAQEPNCAEGHRLLAHGLLSQDKTKEAIAAAKQAIALDADDAFTHYTLGLIYHDIDRDAEAVKCFHAAMRINPSVPEFHAMCADSLAGQGKLKSAIHTVKQGLILDPENALCKSLLANYLSVSGRHQEAAKIALEAAQADPSEAGVLRANGLVELRSGNPKKAREYLEESLRLDPSSEMSREWLLESIKATNPFYRMFLRLMIWLGSLPPKQQVTLLIGMFILFRFTHRVQILHPDMAWLTRPLIASYVVLVLISWFAAPFSNLILLASRTGRLALTSKEHRTSLVFGLALGLCIATLGIGFFYRQSDWLFIPLLIFGGQIPVQALSNASGPRTRKIFAVAAVASNGLILLGLTMILVGGHGSDPFAARGMSALIFGGTLGFLSSWLGLFLR